MSEAEIPSTTLFMRDTVHLSWPEALDQAAVRYIAAGPAALKPYREAALASLRKTGLPRAGSEEFTFIRPAEFLPALSAIPAAASAAVLDGEASGAYQVPKTATMPTLEFIKGLVFPEARDNFVLLIDGEYSPALSKVGPGYRVDYLEAAETGPRPADKRPGAPTGPLEGSDPAAHPAFQSNLLSALGRETDVAANLAALFAPNPLHIRIEAKATPAAPLQVLHLRTTPTAPRRDAFIIVEAGKLSESRLIIRHAQADTGEAEAGKRGTLVNISTVILVDQGASLKWLEAAPEGSANEADMHFHKLAAAVERDARLFVLDTSTGSKLSRSAHAVDLRAPGADAEIHGATVLAGNRQSHRFLHVRHLAAHCTSRQHFKTVAADKGKASVDGTILVGEGAQQTQANQLINNLMLSDEARADSKPRLLIHADDVKCTHGATSGKLDPAQQFYLESRGLSAAQARTLLTMAFIAEVVERADKASAAGGFRAHLDATLLATLKGRLSAGPRE